jgi:hypothetical protein
MEPSTHYMLASKTTHHSLPSSNHIVPGTGNSGRPCYGCSVTSKINTILFCLSTTVQLPIDLLFIPHPIPRFYHKPLPYTIIITCIQWITNMLEFLIWQEIGQWFHQSMNGPVWTGSVQVKSNPVRETFGLGMDQSPIYVDLDWTCLDCFRAVHSGRIGRNPLGVTYILS